MPLWHRAHETGPAEQTKTSVNPTTTKMNNKIRADKAVPVTTAQELSFASLDHTPAPNASPVIAPLTNLRSPVNPLHQIKTRLTVCAGVAEVSVGELVGAKEHQVFRLDRTIDQPLDILLEGQVVARGTLVAVGDMFGIRIVELPRLLTP
jgi:flagellar motor switch protein FliN/FliY